MTGIIIILSVILLAVILVQIGKVNELASVIRKDENQEERDNKTQGVWMLIFGIAFLGFCFVSAGYYANWMLGYGPHGAASAHGGLLDSLFNVTLFFTGLVFLITHVALFWFTFKYRGQKGRPALFLAHNNTLELVWTGIPAIVLTFLVVKGLVAWNEVMPDIDPSEEDVIHIEATGWQFAWNLRYPGEDGELGVKDFRLIEPGVNELGQDWTDPRNHDDFMASELVLPVNKKVRVSITSRDVLHNFYLPHFRVKMDAVPGIPTYFIFTPTKTTEEYRQELKKYPDYNVPSDPEDPESEPLWKTFNYELACAELCGKGHYSMRRLVRIVSEEEYEAWKNEQNSHYLSMVHNTDSDPLKGVIVEAEKKSRTEEFSNLFESAINTDVEEDKTLDLEYVYFESGSSALEEKSTFELNNLIEQLNKYPEVNIEIAGHTDNTGSTEQNFELSQDRAVAIQSYLINNGVDPERIIAKGYGASQPVESNDTEEGRALNRRIELKVL
ncbi:MAG: OmpA family protein [Saprospiraceae bacterium]|nr:OmpA family protein [Saprospiraceae bacterium]